LSDKDFLKIAVEEGKDAVPPYLFGAVVAKNGKIIAKSHSYTRERSDPSAHAEVSAIVEACKALGNHNIPGCTLYASHEPCMMCFACAAWAEIDHIVFAESASPKGSTYEFDDVNIFDMAKKLGRPMKVERIEVGAE
jgi:tRNA(Arg) A34 adenosine deaminase TadA